MITIIIIITTVIVIVIVIVTIVIIVIIIIITSTLMAPIAKQAAAVHAADAAEVRCVGAGRRQRFCILG